MSNFGGDASQIPRDFMESFVYHGDGVGNSISSVFGHIPKDDDVSSDDDDSDDEAVGDLRDDGFLLPSPLLSSSCVVDQKQKNKKTKCTCVV